MTLSQMHGALSLFAEAIVGAPTPIDASDELSCWPWHPSDPTATRVIAPAEIDAQDVSGLTYRSLVLHQLVALELRAGEPTVDMRALEREHPLLPAAYAILEDTRAMATTTRRYPGATVGVRTMVDAAVATRTHGRAPSDDRPAALVALHHAALTLAGGQTPSAGDPVTVAASEAVAAVASAPATRQDSLDEAVRFLGTVAGVVRLAADLDGVADDGIEGLDPEESEGTSLDASGNPTETVEADGLSGGAPANDLDIDEATGSDDEEDEDVEETTMGLSLPVLFSHVDPPPEVRTYLYDEWDFREQRHRPAWCRVLEEHLHGDDHEFIVDVRSRLAALRLETRRRFARLKPEDLVRVHRSDDGEELDLDAVLEAVIDRRSGAPADDRLNVRRDRAARDVATVFLVDLSASTSSPVAEPEPDPRPELDPMDDPMSYAPIWDPGERDRDLPRRVIDVAKDAVALMSDALHELGDRHAIYGFSGSGRHQVDLKVAKDFEDRVSATTWAAVAAMKPLRYTRMGPAIRHATVRLAAQSARTRLLIVISDGYPQDVDYGQDARDREYGINDTARALADAQDRGIDTFCITIDPAGHDYLRDMTPERRYLVIDDVEALPEELAKVYLGLSAR